MFWTFGFLGIQKYYLKIKVMFISPFISYPAYFICLSALANIVKTTLNNGQSKHINLVPDFSFLCSPVILLNPVKYFSIYWSSHVFLLHGPITSEETGSSQRHCLRRARAWWSHSELRPTEVTVPAQGKQRDSRGEGCAEPRLPLWQTAGKRQQTKPPLRQTGKRDKHCDWHLWLL